MAAVTKGKRRLMGDINVVPYIDVMLVLLIIFMITAPLLTQGIKVDLPKANAEAIASQANQPPLVLSIDAQGQLYLNLGASRSTIRPRWCAPQRRCGERRNVRCWSTATRRSVTAVWFRPWSSCNRQARARSASRPIRCRRRRCRHE
jgi:hypothetical protein